MTTTQQAALCLIKSAITGIADPLPEDFRLRAAVQLMFSQGLGAMCHLGLQNYKLPLHPKMQEFLEDQYCLTHIHSQQQMEQIQAICDAFEKNAIHYMPVKGSIIKPLYPDHAMRTMCDADILIHEEEYERIRPVMQALNFQETGESDHEHIWENQHLTVELHKRLIPTYNKDYYSYFGEGWDLAKVQNGCRWAMTHEDAFLYDIIHFAKHYRDANVNAHFLIDLWIHIRSFPDIDQIYIRNQMRRMRMEAFYDNILLVIRAWFENGPITDRVDKITDILLDEHPEQKQEHMALAKNTKAAQEAGSASKARLRRLLIKIFPDKEHMGFSYPQWKQLPLPLAWVLRWFSLLFRRKNSGKAEHHAITEQDMESYRQDLEYIGLEFSDQVVLPD